MTNTEYRTAEKVYEPVRTEKQTVFERIQLEVLAETRAKLMEGYTPADGRYDVHANQREATK